MSRDYGTYEGKTARQIADTQDGSNEYGMRFTGSLCWQYRTSYDRAGYLQDTGPSVCEPERADCISIEAPSAGGGGIVAILPLH